MQIQNELKEILRLCFEAGALREALWDDAPDLEQFIEQHRSKILALGKPEPLAKNKQCDDNFNCDWYNDPDFPDTKCKTQCSTCFAANDF